MVSSNDLTVAQVRNLIDAAIQKRMYRPDTPFTQFLEEFAREREDTDQTGKPLGNRKAPRT